MAPPDPDPPTPQDSGRTEHGRSGSLAPEWLWSFERGHIVWANEAALAAWGVESLLALQASEIGDKLGRLYRHRLAHLRNCLADGDELVQFWSVLTERPFSFIGRASGLWLEDDSFAMRMKADESHHTLTPEVARVLEFFHRSATALAICDVAGRFLHRNEAWLDELGIEGDDIQAVLGDDAILALVAEADEPPPPRRFESVITVGDQPRVYAVEQQWIHDVALPGSMMMCLRLENVTQRKEEELELRRLAYEDRLTGAGSRLHILNAGKRLLIEAVRYERDLCLFVFDIDHFKAINDSHGHGAGDDVLTTVIARSREVLRASDLIGRLGGDEFAVWLPTTTLGDASSAADRLLSAVTSEPVRTRAGEVQVSLSIGVTQAVTNQDSVDSVIERADDALMQAKRGGRGRVVSSSS